MNSRATAFAVLLWSTTLFAAEPIRLNSENPHYFQWRRKPTILITSGEHYGSVMNLDFKYDTYLRTLQREKLNLTRTFSGAYVEPVGAFNITSNVMAPASGRYLAPWARSTEPGYANGGNKFDLNKWDEKYFQRLHDFVRRAGDCGVVVELNLFCPFYEESQWKLSPQNAINNINNVGTVERTNVYTMDKHGGLLAVHDTLVRKLVTELNDYDNVYYEVCNEPYFGGVTMEWQEHIADVIVKTERVLPNKHLISLNIANGSKKIVNPHPAVSIFNFHYAFPPKAVAENYELNKVIGLNETGFKGTNDAFYRMEAWSFLLAGGALYNNLDYSFVPGHEKGTFVYPEKQPGGGNPEFRRQLGVLREFMHSLDFVAMQPGTGWIKSGTPEKTRVYGLAQDGKQYAAYFSSGTNTAPAEFTLSVDLPKGSYRAEWIEVVSGKTSKSQSISGGAPAAIASPNYHGEIALRIKR